MRHRLIELGALTVALGLAVGGAVAQTAQPASAVSATASLQDAQGNSVGQIMLIQYDSGVVIRGELTGLPPGWHGFHVHETGQCDPTFKAAGDHFNPGNTQHGLDEGEPHAGDLASVWANDAGVAQFEMMTDRISLAGEQEVAEAGQSDGVGLVEAAPAILDQDGAAVMIHSKPDDYSTDPGGGSGDRIACGVIKQS